MTEYTEKQAAIEAFGNADADVIGMYPDGSSQRGFGMQAVTGIISGIPTADVAPVVHAYWAPCFDDDHRWLQGLAQCSNCGREYYACTIKNINYCPNCGAKMDGGDADAEPS